MGVPPEQVPDGSGHLKTSCSAEWDTLSSPAVAKISWYFKALWHFSSFTAMKDSRACVQYQVAHWVYQLHQPRQEGHAEHSLQIQVNKISRHYFTSAFPAETCYLLTNLSMGTHSFLQVIVFVALPTYLIYLMPPNQLSNQAEELHLAAKQVHMALLSLQGREIASKHPSLMLPETHQPLDSHQLCLVLFVVSVIYPLEPLALSTQ